MTPGSNDPTAPVAGALLGALLGMLLAIATAGPAAAQDREVKVTGQVRVRPEFRDNADFDRGTPDRQKFAAQRARFGAEVIVNPKVTGRVVAQDVRVWGTERSTTDTGTGVETLDLLEGYLDLRWIWDLPLDARLGRQQLKYGQERLVGPLEWANTARRFDAYRIRFGLGGFFVDFFSAKLVETSGPPGAVRRDVFATGVSDQDRNFSGAYFSKEGDRLEQLDLYWLRDIDKTSPSRGEAKRHTFGVLGRYAIRPDLVLEIEYDVQTGEAADTLDISASSVAVAVGWRPRGSRGLIAGAGVNRASGDPDGTEDHEIETFNQLFPTGHRFFGIMDYVGRQNVQSVWGRVGARLLGGLAGRADVHYLRLDRSQDAWYAASGRPNIGARPDFGPDPTRSARELGIELDLVFDLDFAKGTAIQFGYSRFFPRAVVSRNGGPADDSDFGYASFLVDL